MRLPEQAAEQAASAVGQGLVLPDFYQATCPPCRTLEPRLDGLIRDEDLEALLEAPR